MGMDLNEVTMASDIFKEELIEVVPGADHFFQGREEDLVERLVRIFSEVCRRP
jgi:alpha/beta superfamily hydrolase